MGHALFGPTPKGRKLNGFSSPLLDEHADEKAPAPQEEASDEKVPKEEVEDEKMERFEPKPEKFWHVEK